MKSIRLGDLAPNFRAKSTEGEINFHDWLGNSWGILFSHPADYTPVCTTELGAIAKCKAEFDKRNVKILALSEDSLESHRGWIKDINETQRTTINFPIIADEDRKIAVLYDMIHPNADDQMTVRSVFVVDPDKKVRLMITYPASTGRNFDEILRVIDSLQLTAYHQVATPANWHQGEDCVIVPSVPEDQLAENFPKGYTEIKSYLRYTPQPDL
ncbi:MAG: peroxidase [Lutibacter sp.]|nr:MAG: peroxidase [Lutibacter sp.]